MSIQSLHLNMCKQTRSKCQTKELVWRSVPSLLSVKSFETCSFHVCACLCGSVLQMGQHTPIHSIGPRGACAWSGLLSSSPPTPTPLPTSSLDHSSTVVATVSFSTHQDDSWFDLLWSEPLHQTTHTSWESPTHCVSDLVHERHGTCQSSEISHRTAHSLT